MLLIKKAFNLSTFLGCFDDGLAGALDVYALWCPPLIRPVPEFEINQFAINLVLRYNI